MNSMFIFSMMFLAVSCKNKSASQADTTSAAEAATASGKSYNVDPAGSIMMWEGTKLAGAHSGTINVSAGNITAEGGKITSGEFVIDMNSINVTDLEGDDKAYLESHLKGSTDKNADDFFNVATYPTSKFVITKVTELGNDPTANSLVYGNLTMKDITKQIAFKANIDVAEAGINVSAPKFTIDRTDWGIKYGSDKFFDNLKDKAINDNIELQIKLMAK